jgi:hypothetical protein
LVNPDYSAEGLIKAAVTGGVGRLTKTWRDKKDDLYKLFKDKKIFVVQTHDERLPNMKIDSITPLYDADDLWDAWIGTVTFIEVRTLGGLTRGGKFDQDWENVGAI